MTHTKSGAGIFLIARDTGRLLLIRRSRYVSESGSWVVPGGKIEHGETPSQAARRELREEAGHEYTGRLAPMFVFESSDLRFYNFAGNVQREFEPRLNIESDDGRWFDSNSLPDRLHFGVRAAMRKNPTPMISGAELVEALTTLASQSRSISLANYMILKKHFERTRARFPSYRSEIVRAMSARVLERIFDKKKSREEIYSASKTISSALLYGTEKQSGISIEKIYLIAFVASGLGMDEYRNTVDGLVYECDHDDRVRKIKSPNVDNAIRFGEMIASWSLGNWGGAPFGIDWLGVVVPVIAK